jgi:hypothetical protein
MTPIADLRKDLAAGRERLLAAISGVSEEQFKRRPPATETDARPWSIAEVLGHVLQEEVLRGERIARALAASGSAVASRTPEEQALGAQSGRVAPVPQLIHGLLASRRKIELLLDEAASLPDGLERYVVHPEFGHMTVASMLNEGVIAHEAEHVAQILATREAIGAAAGASA